MKQIGAYPKYGSAAEKGAWKKQRSILRTNLYTGRAYENALSQSQTRVLQGLGAMANVLVASAKVGSATSQSGVVPMDVIADKATQHEQQAGAGVDGKGPMQPSDLSNSVGAASNAVGAGEDIMSGQYMKAINQGSTSVRDMAHIKALQHLIK